MTLVVAVKEVCERCRHHEDAPQRKGWWCGHQSRYMGTWEPTFKNVIHDDCPLYLEHVVCR